MELYPIELRNVAGDKVFLRNLHDVRMVLNFPSASKIAILLDTGCVNKFIKRKTFPGKNPHLIMSRQELLRSPTCETVAWLETKTSCAAEAGFHT